MAFGQERLLVTPLQMAMVAGTIGNGGILMRPFVVEKIVTPNGKTRDAHAADEDPARGLARDGARRRGDDGARRRRPAPARRRRSPASQIGGKTARPRPGSTGTTRPGSSRSPATEGEKPKLAIAVVLQNQSLTGGATAAPIARQVMQALLTPTANP